jgi:hypothetical protein
MADLFGLIEPPSCCAKCDNCGAVQYVRELKPVKHYWERVDDGGETPAGECMFCGCLAYFCEELDGV